MGIITKHLLGLYFRHSTYVLEYSLISIMEHYNGALSIHKNTIIIFSIKIIMRSICCFCKIASVCFVCHYRFNATIWNKPPRSKRQNNACVQQMVQFVQFMFVGCEGKGSKSWRLWKVMWLTGSDFFPVLMTTLLLYTVWQEMTCLERCYRRKSKHFVLEYTGASEVIIQPSMWCLVSFPHRRTSPLPWHGQ